MTCSPFLSLVSMETRSLSERMASLPFCFWASSFMSRTRMMGMDWWSARWLRRTSWYFPVWVLWKDSRDGVAEPRTMVAFSRWARRTAMSRAW